MCDARPRSQRLTHDENAKERAVTDFRQAIMSKPTVGYMILAIMGLAASVVICVSGLAFGAAAWAQQKRAEQWIENEPARHVHTTRCCIDSRR